MSDLYCPACNKPLKSPKSIPKHTNGCPLWDSVIGVPPSQFNFDKHFGRGVWASEGVEGIDFVECRFCVDVRALRLTDHLRKAHSKISKSEYLSKFGEGSLLAYVVQDQRKKTNRERFGVDFSSQNQDVKKRIRKTVLDNPEKTEEGRRKAIRKNLDRYGVANVFASEEIKAKIKQSNLDRYGVENPNQCPEIRAKTEKTNLERYGSSMFLQSKEWFSGLARKREVTALRRRERLIASGRYEVCPHCDRIFTAITSTHKSFCEGYPNTIIPDPCLCGHMSTSWTVMKRHRVVCSVWQARDRAAVFREKVKTASIGRFGVTWPMKSEMVKAKVKATNFERLGVCWPGQSLEVQKRVLNTMTSRYGSHFFGSKLGKAKIRATCWARYGSPFANTIKGPNGLERAVWAMTPELLYTGDRSFWRWIPSLRSYKNPDFLVPGPDPEHPKRGVTKVVEAFGDYWHSEKFTGKSKEEHTREMVAVYAEVGIQCLVLWESEVRKDSSAVVQKLSDFLKPSIVETLL